ncbi:MAG: 3-keto-5-aminohexanoate cleavage protein [Candidatus Limnocylindrales bacterium]
MSDELILNLCPTGMVPTRSNSPYVPLTADEVAADVRRCAEAGASIVHLHPRDDEGRPSQDPEVAAEFIRSVRAAAPEVVICITTSGRANPELARRVKAIELEGDAKPEMASLTLGSLNFPKQPSISSPETIQGLAQAMQDRGVVPELEIFDFGMLDYAHYLRDRGLLPGPVYANFLLGSLGALAATPLNIALLVERLPSGATWAAAGIGRYQFEVNRLAIAMGGGVRVGLEDNTWFDEARTDPASNPRLVERLVTIARAMGREPATPAQVRERLRIPPRQAGLAL